MKDSTQIRGAIMKVSTKMTNLLCPHCGNVSTIQRMTNSLKEEGHSKNLNCPYCKSMQRTIEIPDMDSYNYRTKYSENASEVKLFSKNFSAVSVNVRLTIGTFRKWKSVIKEPINEKIFEVSEYNLMETLILNFLNTKAYKEKVMHDYKLRVKNMNKTILSETINFKLNRVVFNRFMEYCRANDIEPSVLIQSIIDDFHGSEIKYDFSNKHNNHIEL